MNARGAIAWPSALLWFRILFVAFIVTASATTFAEAWDAAHTAGHEGVPSPALLLVLSALEIPAAILFVFRTTEIAGGVVLLIEFAIAEVLSLMVGEITLRFLFYSGTVLFILGGARRWFEQPSDAVGFLRD